ncbi:MAG: dihydrofolate reductase, partial [Alphaproteobacteria bacterium]
MSVPSDLQVVIVVACARNRVIGQAGDLPWRLASDLKFFRAQTMGKPVIMGRKTYESIGKPLAGRDNIVVTRNPDFAPPGIIVTASLAQAFEEAGERARQRGVSEIAVIGGAEIYEQALPHCDTIILTEVHGEYEGDAFFPRIEESDWREAERDDRVPGEGDSDPHSFV